MKEASNVGKNENIKFRRKKIKNKMEKRKLDLVVLLTYQ